MGKFHQFPAKRTGFHIDLLAAFQLLLQVCCPYDAQSPIPQPPAPTNTQNSGNAGASLRASDLPAPGICGFSVDDRIVGGNETRITEYPWSVGCFSIFF